MRPSRLDAGGRGSVRLRHRLGFSGGGAYRGDDRALRARRWSCAGASVPSRRQPVDGAGGSVPGGGIGGRVLRETTAPCCTGYVVAALYGETAPEFAPTPSASRSASRPASSWSSGPTSRVPVVRFGIEVGFQPGLDFRTVGPRQVALIGPHGPETPEMTEGGTEGYVADVPRGRQADVGAWWRRLDLSTLLIDTSVSGAVDVDRDDAATHDLTLTDDATLTPIHSDPTAGEAIDLRLLVRQDGTGGWTLDVGRQHHMGWRHRADDAHRPGHAAHRGPAVGR